ncbi:pirin family protein [Nannocystis radixulma]|uniref:Pirin family protein n=1 Tax=Nannocystis radixulma TaxID=2995305 RepID=A0ABT5BME9_9BACT|nr:pirin family protein [Nannocystis radixulma]MCY1053644.1 pirin family protein [Nannocystis sp. SCPEA4]MDC0674136.1 pirin family protein [Nannocystis radixulma]
MSPTRRALLKAAPALIFAGCTPPSITTPVVKKSAKLREVTAMHPFQPSRDGAGVTIRRALGHRGLPDLDPFLLLDEIRSDRPDEYQAGFPEHPHRGFETVSYVLAGAFEHRDSVGNHGRIGAGATQWMTAGRGIVHEEMPRQQDGGKLWAFQLWVNLPAAEKMTKPRYQELGPETIPMLTVDDAQVRLVAGELAGQRGPVDGVTVRPLLMDVTLEPGAGLRQPIACDLAAFAYVLEGAARFGGEGRELLKGQVGVLGQGNTLALSSDAGARLLLLAGRPLREPVARRGPFVMNTEDELRQAFADYRSGRLIG